MDRLRAQATAPALFAVAVAAIAALVLTAMVYPGNPVPRSAEALSTSASVDGLSLSVRINSTQVVPGGAVAINVSETNTKAIPLNESASSSWAVQGLRMTACYASIYPFGAAVLQGRYTAGNVSGGVPLNLYPMQPCPLLIRYISGYYFQPSSDVAVVLPGSGPGVAMAAGVVTSGSYSTGRSLTVFAPGQYTVVAGDEWGSLAFVYFTVS